MSHSQVLVIDDDRQDRGVLAEILTKEGAEVSEAGDGPNGLAMLERKPYQVLFTKLRMPGMDGLTVVRRAMQLRPELGTVLLSGYGNLDSCIEAMRLGVRDFVAKPFTLETIRRGAGKGPEWPFAEVRRLRRPRGNADDRAGRRRAFRSRIPVCWVKARRCARSGSSPRRLPLAKPRS